MSNMPIEPAHTAHPAPHLDATAAARLAQLGYAQNPAPWLHEEIGRRLQDRIDIVQLPAVQAWANWHYPQGGMQWQQDLAARWAPAPCYAPTLVSAEESTINSEAAQEALTPKNSKNIPKNSPKPWWQAWRGKLGAATQTANAAPTIHPFSPAPQSVQVLVANMLLHRSSQPQPLLQAWQQSLATGGVLFFSALGPDTLRPLQQLYARLGWPPALQNLVDMHDWGDALVQTGFATPVMEVEHLHLSYSSPQALLSELRSWGRNLHPRRFAALRGRGWLAQLHAELEALRSADGRIYLPIEVIYGHAFKPAPKASAAGENIISLDQLRKNLRA